MSYIFLSMFQSENFSTFNLYLQLGIEHILPNGLDHILFIVGIFLLSSKFKHIFWEVSTFTIAHTLTLALSTKGLFHVSPAIVEPIISFSILFICIENILTSKFRYYRLIFIFSFGLIHGLGFANTLSIINMDNAYFLISLIGFNVGVEIGQLIVIGICFMTIGLWFSKKEWYKKRITVPISIVISIIALYWTIERIFFN